MDYDCAGSEPPQLTEETMKVADKIRTEMAKATRWMSVSDLQQAIGCSTSAIRRNLRKNESLPAYLTASNVQGLYKSQKIPGDRHGRNQWALESLDTTGWDNAAPIAARSRKTKTSLNATGRLSYSNPLLSTNPRSANSCSYKGLTLMCAPANKPSLIKAVGDLLVNEFVTSGKKFSAFDITKRLRDIVLAEAKDHEAQMAKLPPGTRQTFAILLEPQEQGTIFVQGLEVCKVEHDDVKAIVHDIFNAGGMPGLGRIHTQGYWEYDTQANIDVIPAPSSQAPAPLPVAAAVSAVGTSTGRATAHADPEGVGTTILTGSEYDGTSTI